MKRTGFTVLELLVASLLLAMLVTVLTMIFNQSSIAWRTGVAGVVELNTVRSTMGAYHDMQDDALPGLGQTASQAGAGASDSRDILYRTVSVFSGWDGSGQLQTDAARNDSNCRGRLYDKLDSSESASSMFQIGDVRVGRKRDLGSGNSPGGSAFAVGVRSLGPNKDDPSDDISTFPKEVN